MMPRRGNWSRALYPLVAKLVRAHRPARSAEEDLCQMIFIKIMQKLSQFSGKVPLEHWVSRIAINTCINQIQAEKGAAGIARGRFERGTAGGGATDGNDRPGNSRPTSALPRVSWSSILCWRSNPRNGL